MAKIMFKPHEGMEYEWIPKRGSAKAAGWDLFAAEERILRPFEPQLVPVKFDIELPPGHCMFVMPRSGNALNRGLLIPNSPGLIDEDYRGHAQVIMMWTLSLYQMKVSIDPTTMIKPGDRIAQVVLLKYEEQEWEMTNELSKSDRGAGGFGSTDTSPKTGASPDQRG